MYDQVFLGSGRRIVATPFQLTKLATVQDEERRDSQHRPNLPEMEQEKTSSYPREAYQKSQSRVRFCDQVVTNQIPSSSDHTGDALTWYSRAELAAFRETVRQDGIRMLNAGFSDAADLATCNSKKTNLIEDEHNEEGEGNEHSDMELVSCKTVTEFHTTIGLEAYANIRRGAQRILATRIIIRCHRNLLQKEDAPCESKSRVLAKAAQRIAAPALREAQEEGICNFCEVYPELAMEQWVFAWTEYMRILGERTMQLPRKRDDFLRLCQQKQQQQQQHQKQHQQHQQHRQGRLGGTVSPAQMSSNRPQGLRTSKSVSRTIYMAAPSQFMKRKRKTETTLEVQQKPLHCSHKRLRQ